MGFAPTVLAVAIAILVGGSGTHVSAVVGSSGHFPPVSLGPPFNATTYPHAYTIWTHGCGALRSTTYPSFSAASGAGSMAMYAGVSNCMTHGGYGDSMGYSQMQVNLSFKATGFHTIRLNISVSLSVGWNVTIPECSVWYASAAAHGKCSGSVTWGVSGYAYVHNNRPWGHQAIPNASNAGLWAGSGLAPGYSGSPWISEKCSKTNCTTRHNGQLVGTYASSTFLHWNLTGSFNATHSYTLVLLFGIEPSSSLSHSASTNMRGATDFVTESLAFKVQSALIY